MAVPNHVLEHLKKREGFSDRVYLDSLGKMTGGVGHLLLPEEQEHFMVGDIIGRETINAWLIKDTERAWLAAENQARGIDCPELQEALFHVAYQLGPAWFTIHKKTWQYLKDKNYDAAAVEATDSTWFKQTPIRVLDFCAAILGVKI